MKYKVDYLIATIEEFRACADRRSEFYESPENRCIVLTNNEDIGTYRERRYIDRDYHSALKDLKKVLKTFGFSYDLSWSSTFYDNYMNIHLRQRENRSVKKIIYHFGLEHILLEWNIARSMGARLRLLQRHYGNNVWWKIHVGKKYSDRYQACLYKNEYQKLYFAQRKVVFKAIREYAKKKKLNYKLFPLNPREFFNVDCADLSG